MRVLSDRWLIAVAAVIMTLPTGGIHAWSLFTQPLAEAYNWSLAEVTLTYSIVMLPHGVIAFFGGLLVGRLGSRNVGILAGLLYGLGVFLASLAVDRLWLLYLTFGVLGGIGRTLAFIVPVAVVVKWFPDRRGLLSGIAGLGLSLGSLVIAPFIGQLLPAVGVMQTFSILGLAYFVLVVGSAMFLKDPPDGYRPDGWQPSAAQADSRVEREYTVGEALRTWQWYALWSLVFLNGAAGVVILSQAAPMAAELTGADALAAAGLIGILALAQSGGRLVLAWLSDYTHGRQWVFLGMFVVQAVVFIWLPFTADFLTFTILAVVVLMCWGGGLGVMPAFTADYFGPKNVGAIFGLMLTTHGLGTAVGPILVAWAHDAYGSYAPALYATGGVMLLSALLPFVVRRPRPSADGPIEEAVPATG